MHVVLLEIDWQNWIMALAHDPCAAFRGREIRRLVHSLGWPVITTRYESLEPDDRDADFVPGFDPLNQPVITKHSRDIFDVPRTDEALRSVEARRILLTGLITTHGIQLAARSALTSGYAVTVIADACADINPDAHRSAIASMEQAGVNIQSTDDVVRWLWAQGSPVGFGIAEVAAMTGLSRDTLRWYERKGLIPAVGRNGHGHRRYDDRAIRMIQLLVRLRRTGMPVEDMRRYIEMVSEGTASHGQRLALLQQHRAAVQKQIDQLIEDVAVLDYKIGTYQQGE